MTQHLPPPPERPESLPPYVTHGSRWRVTADDGRETVVRAANLNDVISKAMIFLGDYGMFYHITELDG